MNKSVYIHIPFCKSICSYCDFCKVLYNEEWANLYLQKLSEEIKDKYDFFEALITSTFQKQPEMILKLKR